MRTGWERRVHASCEGRDWETGAGTWFANQPFAQGDGGTKGWERERESVWVGLGLGDAVPDRKASKLQARMKNTPSQAGARDPACHITPVSSAGRGGGRHVGHGGTRCADQRMRETILGAAAVTFTSRHPALPKPNGGEIYVAIGGAGTRARGRPNIDARADTITFKGSPPRNPRLAAREYPPLAGTHGLHISRCNGGVVLEGVGESFCTRAYKRRG